MYDLSNCRFNFSDETTVEEKLTLQLILLSKDKISWINSDKQDYLSGKQMETTNFMWVRDNRIFQSTHDYSPFKYLPLLDYKEVIKNC